MSSDHNTVTVPPLDLSKYRKLPTILMVVGAIGAAIGFFAFGSHQFSFSWLLAFMFFLSIGLGAWFLVMLHHMFDASWWVPLRRITENLSCILPWMALAFIPIAYFAPTMYPWMGKALQANPDHALHAKFPLFTYAGFYGVAVFCFAVWSFFPTRLRFWSLKQDETGSAACTFKMRRLTGFGIMFFAVTLTAGAIMWMKALFHEWFSTMYGVTYFASSVWLTLATVYVITVALQRTGPLKYVVTEKTYYFLGSLFFAFTVFYAYVTFSQYFIIWNANMPEETYYFLLREKGSWDVVGKYVIIFGHFFVPFLALLRIDAKLKLFVMLPLAAWVWLMHFVDLEFQIMPIIHPEGLSATGLIVDVACMLFFAGAISEIFIRSYFKYPAFPQKDPRIAEAMDVYIAPAAATGGAK